MDLDQQLQELINFAVNTTNSYQDAILSYNFDNDFGDYDCECWHIPYQSLPDEKTYTTHPLMPVAVLLANLYSKQTIQRYKKFLKAFYEHPFFNRHKHVDATTKETFQRLQNVWSEHEEDFKYRI